MTFNTERHSGLINGIDVHTPVHIIGCGSIGTAFATTLCRLGFDTMTLWDFDSVEAHNIANQYFDADDIGQTKVMALREKLRRINPDVHCVVRNMAFRIDRYTSVDDTIIVIGVDSMRARQSIMELLYEHRQQRTMTIIDMRMGGEMGSIHTYKGSDFAFQLHRLPDDDATADLPCTMRTVIYTVNVVASIGAKLLLQTLVDDEQRDCMLALTGPDGPEILTLITPRTASVQGGD